MQALIELLQKLSDSEREALLREIEGEQAVHFLLIRAVFTTPDLSATAFISAQGITTATFNKSLSLALSVVSEFLARHISTPYDDIYLVRELVIRGLTKQAKHTYSKLEKTLEQKLQYSQLNALYHEGTRICYHTGDKEWLEVLRKKIRKNSDLLARYNEIDKAIMVSVLKMVRKPSKNPIQAKEIHSLTKAATAFGHPVLVHNALTTELAYYTGPGFDLEQAFKLIKALNSHVPKTRDHLEAYSYTLARYNYSKFICDFIVPEDPEPIFEELRSRVGTGGTLEVISFYVNFFCYFLSIGEVEKALAIAQKISKEQAQDRVSYLKEYIAAWVAWVKNDPVAFRNAISAYYAAADRRDSPVNDFYTRVLETDFAIKNGSFSLAYSKVEALKKFSYRSLPAPQRDFLLLVNALHRNIQSNERPALKPKHLAKNKKDRLLITHRIVRFLFDKLS